jgi:hypothetical protein
MVLGLRIALELPVVYVSMLNIISEENDTVWTFDNE